MFPRIFFSLLCVLLLLSGCAGSRQSTVSLDQPVASLKNKKRAWLKYCNYKKVITTLNGSPSRRYVCITHFEIFSTNGRFIVSGAARKVSGVKHQDFLIMLPPDVSLSYGVRFHIDKKDTVYKMAYEKCIKSGCAARMILSPKLLRELKQGRELRIAFRPRGRKPVGYIVSLNGFNAAYNGKPIDNRVYATARQRMFQRIRRGY